MTGQGGKQFILQKSGVPGSQHQIVTLVKTSKGLTPVSVNLIFCFKCVFFMRE